MCGHEHVSNHQLISDIATNDALTYLEGASLQNDSVSVFSTYVLDTESNMLKLREFTLKDDYYSTTKTSDVLICNRKSRSILNDSFAE